MTEPVRSAALKKALAEEADELPREFAARVAELAEARDETRRFSWSDAALFGAFVVMIGVCVAGWFAFGPQEADANAWLDLSLRDLPVPPWLVVGIVGLGVVQLLTFRRRVRGQS